VIRRLADACSSNGESGGQLDWYSAYENLAIGGPPDVALDMILAVCDVADNDALCWIGVAFIEPLLDNYWETIGERLEREASRRPSLRKALSCASLHLKPYRRGLAFEQRLLALIRPEEDIGRSTS
jgi:hypothetical protein